ncbi:MAG: phosphonopyruvate decarboxylase [Acidaminococcaceae bacterium]|nr:phosphonopyruvate decarboxylase [Acidaminococcaceae bacterium]
MLDQEKVFNALAESGVTFFTGVPDSYLNGFCNYALAHCGDRNVIAANEGNAIGIASGHYFASQEIPLVYMQNSGMGNTVNPLASLVDKDVYAVPMLLLIGWRGQGNTEPNHPQHKLQGEITPGLLELMHIPYTVLADGIDEFKAAVIKAVAYCKEHRQPYGLISPKGVMAGEKANNKDAVYPMSREEAIEVVLDTMPANTVYSATTGRATRELFWLRERRGESKKNDFLNVGSMGHASSVALGIAMAKPERHVVVLDGDSAAMMHMGAMTMVSKLHVPNFMHIILNNGAHESVGGQPSAGHKIDFTKIAEACGYQTVGKPVTTKKELVEAIKALKDCGRASFVDMRIHKGLSGELPALKFSHREAIDALIEDLNRK